MDEPAQFPSRRGESSVEPSVRKRREATPTELARFAEWVEEVTALAAIEERLREPPDPAHAAERRARAGIEEHRAGEERIYSVVLEAGAPSRRRRRRFFFACFRSGDVRLLHVAGQGVITRHSFGIRTAIDVSLRRLEAFRDG